MKKHAFLIIFSIMLITIIMGCSQSNKTSCINEIIFQLNWTDDPTFTGEYIAKEKFWFLNKLNVKIKQGGIGIDPISIVISKKADYAVVGADKALVAISDGKPIKIISVDLQRNPVGWIARQNLKILSFEDLRNRKDIILGDKAGTETSAILELVLKRKNMNIKPQAVSFDFSYFLANENVVYPVYLNEEPVKATLVHNLKITEIDPASEINGGIKMYGNVIITHSEKILECPKQVDNLVQGIKDGWNFAKNNKEEALAIVLKYVKNEPNYVRNTMDRTIDFATNMYGKPIPPGHMEYTAWENTLKILKEAKILAGDVDLKNAIYMK